MPKRNGTGGTVRVQSGGSGKDYTEMRKGDSGKQKNSATPYRTAKHEGGGYQMGRKSPKMN